MIKSPHQAVGHAVARRPTPSPGGTPTAARPPVRRARRLLRVLTAVTLLVILTPRRPHMQEVTGPALKAAFLFNFVKFTTWPAEALAEAAPLQMCVVNAQAVGNALSTTVRGRVVAGHAIHVAQPADSEAFRRCHVLFVSGPRTPALQVIAAVGDAPVLTVSDLPAFTAEGGIAQFHLQQGQLRFVFGLEAARTARLQISSKLLALARQP